MLSPPYRATGKHLKVRALPRTTGRSLAAIEETYGC